MRRAQRRKFHFIYKTTCVITGRYYIGMHSTDDMGDGYVGSGKQLWNSIRKHGRESHQCEVIEMYESREAARLREQELVDDDLLKDEMCMNICRGGGYGSTWEWTPERRMTHPSWPLVLDALRRGRQSQETTRHDQLIQGNKHPSRRERNIRNLGTGMLGKKHTVRARHLQSLAHQGPNGQRWLMCPQTGEERRLSDQGLIRDLLESGWVLGRIRRVLDDPPT